METQGTVGPLCIQRSGDIFSHHPCSSHGSLSYEQFSLVPSNTSRPHHTHPSQPQPPHALVHPCTFQPPASARHHAQYAAGIHERLWVVLLKT